MKSNLKMSLEMVTSRKTLLRDHTNSRVSFTLVTNGPNTPTVKALCLKEQRNVAAEKLRK